MPAPAATSRITHLECRRRDMAAEYRKAARRHAPRADLARKLVRATCAALKAEVQAGRQSRPNAADAPAMADLFAAFPVQDPPTKDPPAKDPQP